MDKRTTIHLPAERHRQLREIAARRGFAKITDFLDDVIAREAATLGIASGLIAVALAEGGNLVLSVDGLPDIALTRTQASELAGDVAATVAGDREGAGWGWDATPGIEFRRQGRGFSLAVTLRVAKNNRAGWGYDHHRRGLTEGLARELASALRAAADS